MSINSVFVNISIFLTLLFSDLQVENAEQILGYFAKIFSATLHNLFGGKLKTLLNLSVAFLITKLESKSASLIRKLLQSIM